MADDFLSTILAQLTAPVGADGSSTPAPEAQAQTPLQKQVADAKAVQNAPDVQPQMSQPTSFSPSMPLPQELSQVPQGAASYPQVKGGLTPEQAAAQVGQPPKPTIGGLPGLLANLVNPARGVAPGQQVPSKSERFESFLVNFLQSLSQGLAQEGRGPGSAMRGAAAAIGAPYQQAVQQYQLNQQSQANQAQIQGEKLKNQLTGAQIEQMRTSIPVQMPNGGVVYVPVKDAGHVLGSVAGAQGKISAAQIAADNKISVEELKDKLISGEVAKTLPAIDKDGNVGQMAYNKFGKPIGFMQGALPPSQLMPKSTSTQDFIATDGGIVAVTKTTTSGVQLPSKGASSLPPAIQNKISGGKAPQLQAPTQSTPGALQLPPQVQAARNRASGGVNARFITGPDGQPLLKNGGDNGYAYDKDDHLVYTTRAEAAQSGLTQFEKVSPADVKSDKAALRMLNDVQINKSRYAQAAADYFKNGGDYGNDKWLISKIISENPFSVSGGAFDIHLPAADMMNKIENSKAYTALSPAGKELVDGYYRAKAAVPAYQKALTNIGRSNKEMMDLELNNIPDPILSMDDVQRKLAAFQENIDRATEGFPRFKDIKSPTDIRKRFEPSWNGGNTPKSKFTHNSEDIRQFLSTFSKGKQQ